MTPLSIDPWDDPLFLTDYERERDEWARDSDHLAEEREDRLTRDVGEGRPSAPGRSAEGREGGREPDRG